MSYPPTTDMHRRLADEPSYKDYTERKRREGEKPLDEDAWSARVKGRGDSDGKPSDKKDTGKSPDASHAQAAKGISSGIQKAQQKVYDAIDSSSGKMDKLFRSIKDKGFTDLATAATSAAELTLAFATAAGIESLGPQYGLDPETTKQLAGIMAMSLTFPVLMGMSSTPVLGAISKEVHDWAHGHASKTGSSGLPEAVKKAILDHLSNITPEDIALAKKTLADGKTSKKDLAEAYLAAHPEIKKKVDAAKKEGRNSRMSARVASAFISRMASGTRRA